MSEKYTKTTFGLTTLFESYLFIRWPLQVGFGILLISIQWGVGVIQKTKPKTENCSLNFFAVLYVADARA